MLDIKISGGTIIDGSGAPRYQGDIGIKDGRIVALGEVSEPAHQEIEAKGKVVSPGFVDVHTHYDAQVFWDPTLSPSCYHGVTTIFGGFCGFSIAPLSKESASYLLPMLARVEGMPVESLRAGVPWNWSSFAEYLSRLEGTLAINAGFMAGHSAIRRYVMGPRAVGQKATREEIEKMKDLLRESIRGGALGLSTTTSNVHNDADGNPVPSRHATLDELMELASVVGEFEGTTAEIAPAPTFTDDTYELLTRMSLAANRPVNWNLLSLANLEPDQVARTKKKLDASAYARKRGGEVIALIIPQSISVRINLHSGFLFDTLPTWGDFLKLPVEERIKRLKTPEVRAELKSACEVDLGGSALFANWAGMRVVGVFSKENEPYLNRTVGEIAKEQKRDPFDVFIDVSLADGLRTQFIPKMSDSDSEELYRERAKLWLDDRTVVGGSDAGAHLDMIDSFALPTALLQLGVRKYGVISLEQAVQLITQKSAGMMGLRERGELQIGWHADVVIFDPDRVGQGEIYTRMDVPAGQGRLYAEADGIHHVIVNGREIIRDGKYLGVPAGKILRSGHDTYTVPIPTENAL